MALEASPISKKKRRPGDTIILLDETNLGRYSLVDSSGLRDRSSFFEFSMSVNQTVEAGNHVQSTNILQQPQVKSDSMLKLLRKALTTPKGNCTEMYALRPISDGHAQDTGRSDQENQKSLVASEQVHIDWQSASKNCFCILSRLRPKFCDGNRWKSGKGIGRTIPQNFQLSYEREKQKARPTSESRFLKPRPQLLLPLQRQDRFSIPSNSSPTAYSRFTQQRNPNLNSHSTAFRNFPLIKRNSFNKVRDASSHPHPHNQSS